MHLLRSTAPQIGGSEPDTRSCAFGSTHFAKNTVETDPNTQELAHAGTPTISIFGKTWDFHVTRALGITLEENLKIITKLKREIEDVNSEARTALAPKSEANTIGVYRDIQDAAARFAMANGFEMVLQFQDGFTQEDYNSPMNIMNKMQTRACIPMYYQQGNDISMQVVNALNDAYLKANPGAGTVVPAGGTGGAPKGN